MSLVDSVLASVSERPQSGGALIEALSLRRNAVLVYGALARLAGDGRIRKIREGPGEVIWGVAGGAGPPPREPGAPESFRMGDEEQAWIEAEVWRMTAGLPSHYFEELRRAVVARADRIAYDGARPDAAAREAVASLGPFKSAERFLARVEAGKTPPLRLRKRARVRVWILAILLVSSPFLIRLFVVGWYTLPAWQVSMAPTLMPSDEGGDAMILADLVSYRFRGPERGEVVIFRADWGGGPQDFVKRVVGLPGETILVRDGDVLIDGDRWVKERAVLDAVAVRLFGKEGFELDPELPGLRQVESVHTGFRLPDGTVEPRERPAGDVILDGVVRVDGLADSIVVLIKVNGEPRHQVVLTASGYESGVFVEGTSVVRGASCQLKPGRDYALWLTTADRTFRLELDGEEIARHPIEGKPGDVRMEVVLNGDGAAARDLFVSRDLTYESPQGPAGTEIRLGDDEYCLLGDNSPVSRDSRQMGPIPGSTIRGRAWRVILPLHRARSLELPE